MVAMDRAVIGFLVLVVAFTLGVGAFFRAAYDRQQAGLVGSCERVNVLRAQSNITDIAVWRAFSSAAQRETRLIRTDPENRSAHRRSAQTIRQTAGDMTATALTNCDRAVNDPDNYTPPGATRIGDVLAGQEQPAIAVIEKQSRARLNDLLR